MRKEKGLSYKEYRDKLNILFESRVLKASNGYPVKDTPYHTVNGKKVKNNEATYDKEVITFLSKYPEEKTNVRDSVVTDMKTFLMDYINSEKGQKALENSPQAHRSIEEVVESLLGEVKYLMDRKTGDK